MRLINCETLLFEEFFFQPKPPYAILSHTWNDHELTYQEYYDFQARAQYPFATMKIFNACSKAYNHGFKYIWIDSCNIDKKSSSELTESINSMFKWYEESGICYVYMSDFDSGLHESRAVNPVPLTSTQLENFQKSRWFTRGWTLQELLAPKNILFYDSQWNYFGHLNELAPIVSVITKIPHQALSHQIPLYNYTVAQKMSWAAFRTTTREEDRAYCLFGLFNVNLPLFYGEGGRRAFLRLQEAIIKEINDLSIFAWENSSADFYRGALARSPEEFHNAGDITSIKPISTNPEFSMTNKGLKIETVLIDTHSGPLLPLNCQNSASAALGIPLKEHRGIWVRDSLEKIHNLAHQSVVSAPLRFVYITKDVRILKEGESRNSLTSYNTNAYRMRFEEIEINFVPSSPPEPITRSSTSRTWGRHRNHTDGTAAVMAQAELPETSS